MKILLALFLSIPLMAQEPAPKPEEKKADAKPEAKAEAKAESPAPAPAGEQNITGSIDFGYRWLSDVRGNFNAYRSVVNLGEGPKLTGWDFSIQDPKKRYFDRIDTQGIGWGGDPYTTARVSARKMGVYDFSFDYRNMAYFNYLPSYADPLINVNKGFFLDENAFDIRRRMMNIELDLRPGKRIVPYFAYNRGWGSGQGITTFVSDANEYPVATQYHDVTNSVRGGVRFEWSRCHLTIEQGGVTYGDDQLSANSSLNTGNVASPFNGQPLSLTNLLQKYSIDGSAIYSKVLVTAHPAAWVDLYGQLLYSQPKNNVAYSQSAAGQFVDLSSLLFYTGQTDLLGAAVKQPHTSGNLGVEVRPLRRLRIIESWMTDRLHDTSGGSDAVQLQSKALTTSTTTPLAQRLVWNYSQQQVDVLFDLTAKLTLRGGHRYVWGDSSVPAPNLSQAGPFENVQLRQQVGIAGLSFRAGQKLSANFDFEGAASDQTYFRTSLHDYQRARMRARYQATTTLSFTASFAVLNNNNPAPGINYQFESRDNSVSVLWTPGGGKRISVMGDYSRSTVNSDIAYRVPQDGTTARSFYRDNAHIATSVVDVALPGYAGLSPKLSFGGSLFFSAGSRPSSYYQPLARLSIPLHKHLYWNTEWRWYGFGESFYLYEGFRAHVFMTGIRLAR